MFDNISFAPGLTGMVDLESELPHIGAGSSLVKTISIDGSGNAIGVQRSLNPNAPLFRIFTVATGNWFALYNIGLFNGDSPVGGGLFVATDSSAYLDGVFVTANKASDGGGIFNKGYVSLINTSVGCNFATLKGGGVFNEGNLFVATGSIIHNNQALSNGGGIYNAGEDAAATIEDSTIAYNSALTWGGGIANDGGTLEMTGSFLWDNWTTGGGGGLWSNSTCTISTTSILRNRANNVNTTAKGCGFYIAASGSLALTNCTLNDNTADDAMTNGGLIKLGAIFPPPVGGDINDAIKNENA